MVWVNVLMVLMNVSVIWVSVLMVLMNVSVV